MHDRRMTRRSKRLLIGLALAFPKTALGIAFPEALAKLHDIKQQQPQLPQSPPANIPWGWIIFAILFISAITYSAVLL